MLKKLFKEYLFFIITTLVFLFLVFFELPYKIEKTGGLINISDRLGNNTKGSFNMAYVSEIDATVLTYLYSLINSDWDAVKKEVSNSSEEISGKLFFKNANQTAELVAYHLANQDIKIKNTKYYVLYISDQSITDLKVGDELLYVNSDPIKKIEDINDIVNNHNIGDTITLTVINDNKKINKTAKIINYKGEKKIGIVSVPIYEYDSKIKYKGDSSEYGPSGGLMTTLAIYDHITNSNLTKNRIIAGTGTIDIDGNVGEISGIKYKLKGAIKDKATIFFVPKENYKEAIKLKKKYNYNIDIVKVENINEAIAYLKK